MKAEDKEPKKAHWSVTKRVSKPRQDKQGRTIAEVRCELRCNGRKLHELRGEHGGAILQEYADEQNRKGAPEPPKPVLCVADGIKLENH